MASQQPQPTDPDSDRPISLTEFLETIPPGRLVTLDNSSVDRRNIQGEVSWVLPVGQISLHCDQPPCDRLQFFFPGVKETSMPGEVFLRFSCRNCLKTSKTFAVRFLAEGGNLHIATFPPTLSAFKFGEFPQFGPPLPAKLLQLAGSYGALLKKGRQSENQSLGIGAFAYYRRVVEQQKARLIDELKNAVARLGGNREALEGLEAARTETSFTKALKLMADVTPKELFVGGHNPLTLLHGPLSVGIHGMTDEECLSKAHSIRVVLTALLERVQMITEEKADLDAAIKDLLPREK